MAGRPPARTPRTMIRALTGDNPPEIATPNVGMTAADGATGAGAATPSGAGGAVTDDTPRGLIRKIVAAPSTGGSATSGVSPGSVRRSSRRLESPETSTIMDDKATPRGLIKMLGTANIPEAPPVGQTPHRGRRSMSASPYGASFVGSVGSPAGVPLPFDTPGSADVVGQKRKSAGAPLVKIGGAAGKPPAGPTMMPKTVVKGLFDSNLKKMRVSKEAYDEVMTGCSAYFDNLFDDLHHIAGHARRKKIEKPDLEVLFRRQRIVKDTLSLEDLARKHLSRELTDEVLQKAEAQKR